ncbi:hypothetical protein [Paenibacillus sp. JGP012]|uniref:hypothetical protein n=1 Tax=Paenibacillus sp. JGP012 TaxID=2735914 RepID=UPI001C86DA65|nr:hypothetical protein [Paenibacillus sp. JGP012]
MTMIVLLVRKASFVGARMDASVAEYPFDRHYPRILLIHPLQGENSMINANASLLPAISASSAVPLHLGCRFAGSSNPFMLDCCNYEQQLNGSPIE